ncbi:MAG: hypothetical protein MHM6MM_003897 [Cercozoa sp. M6MM]
MRCSLAIVLRCSLVLLLPFLSTLMAAQAQAGHLESVNVLAIVETGSEVQEQMNELEKTLVGLVEQMHRQLQILSQRLQNVMIDDVRPTPRRRKHNVH